MDHHEILLGLHWHDDQVAGLEVACECGAVLHEECDPDGLLSLDELRDIASRHELAGGT
jgi:hypothetical protein